MRRLRRRLIVPEAFPRLGFDMLVESGSFETRASITVFASSSADWISLAA